MLVQVYRVKSTYDSMFYVLIREDDCFVTVGTIVIEQIKNGERHLAYSDKPDNVTELFLPNDKEIELVDTLEEEEVESFLVLYTTLNGDLEPCNAKSTGLYQQQEIITLLP